ncbi:MAG: hypothetical protein JWR83_2860 [Aeromicrobium sp.]|nr:hypothetical protein [Aeromicrobium sp.]
MAVARRRKRTASRQHKTRDEYLRIGPYKRYRATRRIVLNRVVGAQLVIAEGEIVECNGVSVKRRDGLIVDCASLVVLIELGRLVPA